MATPRIKPTIKRPVRLPKSTVVIAGTRQSKSSGKNKKKKKEEKPKLRGSEVSIRQSASPGQVIYGKMKVGGVYSFLDTGTANSSRAYTRTGENNHQIVWIALNPGASGNDMNVTLEVNGTHPINTVTVTGSDIHVRVRSNLGSSLSSANELIQAVRDSASAMAILKEVHRGEGKGTGIVQPQAQTYFTGGGATWLHHVITIACHDIDAVERLYLDDRQVEFGASPDTRWSVGYYSRNTGQGIQPLVFMAVNSGEEDQAAQPDLMGQLPTRWGSNHRQRGCAHAYLITIWDEKKFAQGLPDISFLVRGKKLLDTRTNTTAYSNNAALVIADYLTNAKYGLGVAWGDIDIDALNEAANVCDELVTLLDGSQERRYCINGAFDTSQAVEQTLSEMSDAIAGDIVYQGGLWRILPGKWRAPELTLSRDDTRGAVVVTTRKSRQDTFNCIRGTYASQDNAYLEKDFAPIKVSTYIAEDGKELYEDIVLNFVTSETQAQRIAKIRIGQIRQPITIQASFTLKALPLQVGDVVQYTDPQFAWTNKTFEVRDFSIKDTGGEGILVDVLLVESAQLIYTWTSTDQLTVDPSPNSNFPSFTDITEPSNIAIESGTEHLYIRDDGTVFARMFISWTASDSVYVLQGGTYQIQYKASNTSTWGNATTVDGAITNAYILDVKDGQAYDVRVRAVTALGVPSDWVTRANYTVIGKTAPPSTVNSISGNVDGFGIRLAWTPVPDLDLSGYELRYGSLGQSWDDLAGTAIQVKANQFFFKTFIAGTHVFHIKAIDTSNNYSTASATTSLTVLAPGIVAAYSISQIDNNILVDWTEPTSGTFPVDHYNVYKGDVFSSASKIGQVGGTFYTYIEQTSGEFTYWVTAVDIAGNEGSEVGKSVLVSSPPDYILIDSRNLDPDGATLTRVYNEQNASFLAPANISETWEEHFTSNSNSTIQDFIDDGSTVWLTPTPGSPGIAEWTFDLGVALPQNIINLSWIESAISGSVAVSPRISWREESSDPWTDGPDGEAQVFATNFRYVKVVLTCTGASNLGLVRVSTVFIKIDTKKQSDSGRGTVTVANDGATVEFTLDFIDVFSIVVTPQGTSALIPVVDFDDSPNPTDFTVYLFDTNGAKATGSFRWSAEGVVRTV